MEKFLLETVKKQFDLAVVGGSDLNKITEQLGKSVFQKYKYVFAENGLIAFEDGKQLPTEVSGTIKRHYCQNFSISYLLFLISDNSKCCWRRSIAGFYQFLFEIYIRITFAIQTWNFYRI